MSAAGILFAAVGWMKKLTLEELAENTRSLLSAYVNWKKKAMTKLRTAKEGVDFF